MLLLQLMLLLQVAQYLVLLLLLLLELYVAEDLLLLLHVLDDLLLLQLVLGLQQQLLLNLQIANHLLLLLLLQLLLMLLLLLKLHLLLMLSLLLLYLEVLLRCEGVLRVTETEAVHVLLDVLLQRLRRRRWAVQHRVQLLLGHGGLEHLLEGAAALRLQLHDGPLQLGHAFLGEEGRLLGLGLRGRRHLGKGHDDDPVGGGRGLWRDALLGVSEKLLRHLRGYGREGGVCRHGVGGRGGDVLLLYTAERLQAGEHRRGLGELHVLRLQGPRAGERLHRGEGAGTEL